MSLRGSVYKTGYPVYLTERLLPKHRKLQLEAKQMCIKTVTNSCELQILCPGKEGGVTFRQNHTEMELLKLNNAALHLRNYNTVDNGRPGKRNNHDSTGFSKENKKIWIRKKLLKKFLGNTWSMHKACFQKFCAIELMDMLGLEKKTMKEMFCVSSQNVRSLRENVNLLVQNFSENIMSPSFIAFSETWHSHDTTVVKLLGYQGFLVSNHEKNASGVALFVDQTIQVQMNDLKNIFCFGIFVVDLFYEVLRGYRW